MITSGPYGSDTCRHQLRRAEDQTTVCGVPVEGGTVTPNAMPWAMNCPNCWQAMPFVTGHATQLDELWW